MSLAAGEVFAVVGENGAGKSTLIKILSGVYGADTGEIRLQGERVLLRGPKDAIQRGINTIYQETSLVQDITGGSPGERAGLRRLLLRLHDIFRFLWFRLSNDDHAGFAGAGGEVCAAGAAARRIGAGNQPDHAGEHGR